MMEGLKDQKLLFKLRKRWNTFQTIHVHIPHLKRHLKHLELFANSQILFKTRLITIIICVISV